MKNTFSIITILIYSHLAFAINPDRVYAETPKKYGFTFAEYKLKTADGALINVWDIEPKRKNKNNKVSIIICESDAGNMSYLLAESLGLSEIGFNVVMFDYRGFGQSSNFKHDTTLLFHQEYLTDFETVFRGIKQKHPINKIGTLGFSMGGYFPFITKEKIDFLIADSPLINPVSVIEILNKPQLRIPKNTIVPDSMRVPALIFLGIKDKIISFKDIPPSVLSEYPNYAVVYNGPHLQASYMLQNVFFNQIESFVAKMNNSVKSK